MGDGKTEGKRESCKVCGQEFRPEATDTARVVKCSTCGAPRRLTKTGSASLLKTEWITPTQELWKATQKDVAPGYGLIGGGTEAHRQRAVAVVKWLAGRYPAARAWARLQDDRFAPLP